MSMDQKALETLVAREEIRQLVMLYSRGVDRKDGPLLRSLYAKGATDTHGDTFDGDAGDYVDFLEKSFPYMPYGGHHVCNHLISVDGDKAEGEVYAIAYHVIPDQKGGWLEYLLLVRYIDRYRKENGRWLFAKRVVTYDMQNTRPVTLREGQSPDPTSDPSYTALVSRLFARGPRA